MERRSTAGIPRFWTLLVFATIPVVAAAGTALWLGVRIADEPRQETARLGTEEVIAQDRLLVDAVWSAIETVKTQALALWQIRQLQARLGVPAAIPEGRVLHWAEIEVQADSLGAVKQTVANPSLRLGAVGSDAAQFEKDYLENTLKQVHLDEIRENGVGFVRVKQDPARRPEWLGMAFLASETSLVLVLVDPVEAMPIFRRWTTRSEGGNLRGYLVAADGAVLAHSQRSYVSANFAATQVFQEGVRNLLSGRVVSGAGTYKGIDGMLVSVAYARPGSLPVAAVVERVLPAPLPSLFNAPLQRISHAPIEILAAFGLLGVVWIATALGIWMLLRGVIRQEGVAPDLEAEPRVGSPERRELPPEFGEDLEDQFVRDVIFATKTSGSELGGAVIPLIKARNLAYKAAAVAGAPALFFGYLPASSSAVLQAQSGFEPGEQLDVRGMSFPVSSVMLERVARYRREGRTASLSDDPGLALLLAKRLASPCCDAWPVTDVEGALLGILVVPRKGVHTILHSSPTAHDPVLGTSTEVLHV
ncbi:hypothetical protein WDW37_07120 [Bdellovibrionota bacterium FG-1]